MSKSMWIQFSATMVLALAYSFWMAPTPASAAVGYAVSSTDSASSHKLYLCLHNCALCVRQWEAGLYNGEKCAKKCLRFKANPRIVDPDCNSLKLFNYKVIKRRMKRLQFENSNFE